MSDFKVPKWPKPFKEFAVPLYFGRVYIFDDKEKMRQAEEYMTKKPAKLSPGVGRTVQLGHESGDICFLVGVFNGSTTTLVHELAHTTFFILSAAGVPLDENGTNEAYCYLLDSLFELSCK